MAQVIPIPWMDEGGGGLGGTLEIRASSIPHGARIKDLIAVLNAIVPQPGGSSNCRRAVKFMQLYGSHLAPRRSMEAVIPTMNSTHPRLIATTRVSRVASHRNRFRLYVKMLKGELFSLKCAPSETIGDLKLRIQDSENIPAVQQRLVFGGQQLVDDRTLSDYNITVGSIVVLTLRGGHAGPIAPRVFADLSNSLLLIETEFSSTAPVWRLCSEGLNIEGVCENSQCPAFEHMVIDERGYESFNLYHDTMKCPLCHQHVQPLTCGFYSCKWKYEGMRSSDHCQYSSLWKDALGFVYHRFNAGTTHGTIEWDSLLIIAQRPDEAKGSESECAICSSVLGDVGADVTTTSCRHRFHRKCINEWIGWRARASTPATCPMCRTVMVQEARAGRSRPGRA